MLLAITVLSVLLVVTTFVTLWNMPIVGFFIKMMTMAVVFGAMLVVTVWWSLS